MHRLILGALLLLGLTGCAEPQSSNPPADATGDIVDLGNGTPPPAMPVQYDPDADFFATYHCGSPGPERFTAARNESAWAALWSRCHAIQKPEPERPALDFARGMAVAYSWGNKSSTGYWVKPVNATHTGENLTIEYERGKPYGCPVGAAMTYPGKIVVVRPALNVTPVFRDTVKTCPEWT